MDRRAFLGALGLLAVPFAARAQPAGKVARVGYLALLDVEPTRPAALRAGLRELGWLEGQNLIIEYRSAGGKPARLAELAAQLVGLKLDVLMGQTSSEAQALMRATKTIPIVFGASSDPVADGLVTSLARPGGNVTGSSLSFEPTFSGKWVELLKAARPNTARIAVILNPRAPAHRPLLNQAQLTARAMSMQLEPYEVGTSDDFADVVSKISTKTGIDGLIVFPSRDWTQQRRQLVKIIEKQRLPAIHEHRAWTEAGGLISYGPNIWAVHHRAAFYVDKILRGARPADLPVEQPTKFELVINLKTAKTLGLTIPPSLLQRADQVIE